MVLKETHEKLDEIPEQFQELYTEKDGKFELTGITGVKTQGDVDRVTESLRRQTDMHKETKEKLAIWGDLNHEEIVAKLDKMPELEAAAKGKLDEAEIEAIVTRRVEGTIKSKLAPVERKVKELEKANGVLTEANGKFVAANHQRTIHDDVRKALIASKVLPDAHEDALFLAERVMTIREDDGKVITKDNIGITPGLDASGWLTEIQEKRRHWWPDSVGGGSRGSGPGVGGIGGTNPWTFENWNFTEQGRILKEHGQERAKVLAKAAGTTLGGAKPAPKPARV